MAIIKLKTEEADEQFVLSSGKVLKSPDASRKMRIIAEEHPEISIPKEGVGYAWNEIGMAQLFARCYEEDTKFCAEAKSWYTYSDGAWRKDTGALLVSAKMKEFYQLLLIYSSEIKDEDLRTKYIKFIGTIGDRRFRDRMLKDAADDERLAISASRFDANPYLINCKNGTYDLQTMRFRPHDWHDYLTMQTNFDYTVKDIVCPRWEKFIDEVTEGDKEKAKYIQTAIGYSMLGIANEECMFILHGKTTRNGKSTLLNAVEYLLGDYASVSPVSIICRSDQSRNAEAANPVLASLKGRRFVTMSESNQYGKLDEEVIKQLTGGEEITARNLYESASTWLPQFTMWLSCNDLPAVSDKSLFASERIKVIEFNRHFSAAEQDKNLKTEFRSKEAMQGIFSWMIKGYFHYKRFGLVMPEKMQTVIDQYQRENDLVLQFLEEKCQKSDEDIRGKMLYDSYKIWCKGNGYHAWSAKKFFAEVDTHPEWHGGRITVDHIQMYKNLSLR